MDFIFLHRAASVQVVPQPGNWDTLILACGPVNPYHEIYGEGRVSA